MFVFISLSPQAILIFLCAALTISGQRGDGNSNRRPGSNNNSGDNENSGGSTPGGRGNISFSDFAITAGGGSIVAIVIDPRIFPRCMTSTRYCSIRDSRAYYACERGYFVRRRCRSGRICAYRNGQQLCSRSRS